MSTRGKTFLPGGATGKGRAKSRDTHDTLKERFESLADVIRKICEAELEYQDSDEGRKEQAEAYFYDALFTEEGKRVQ